MTALACAAAPLACAQTPAATGEELTLAFLTLTQSAVVNTLVGADAFYGRGIWGQNAVVSNVESGHFWNGHEALAHVPEDDYYTAVDALGGLSEHATMVAGIIGGLGNETDGLYSYLSLGIAPLASLRSVAFATAFGENGAFSFSDKSIYSAYRNAFDNSTVVNSSWGASGADISDDWVSLMLDGFARANTQTLFVASSGNSGAGANHVGSPARGYNNISVGAAGNPLRFNAVADFSSGGAGDFYNPITHETVAGVRAQVDIVAPGVGIAGPLYDPSDLTMTDYYSIQSGTSFAAPEVAGAAALLQSFSIAVEEAGYGWTQTSRDARVIKAVLMASADHLENWDNAQTVQDGVSTSVRLPYGTLTQAFDGVTLTTQALDWYQGAGSLNLETALGIYEFAKGGWVCGSADYRGMLSYWKIGEAFEGESLRVALAWFADTALDTSIDDETLAAEDGADYHLSAECLANLDLELWRMTEDNDGIFRLVAASRSEYNAVEYLDYLVEDSGYYALRVVYEEMVYGLESESEVYGLAWARIPEPSQAGALCGLFALALAHLRRRAAARYARR